MIEELVSEQVEEPAVVVYLLGDILNDFNTTDSEDQEEFIDVSNCSYSQVGRQSVLIYAYSCD